MAGYKGSTFDNDLLKLIFNATAIANIADNAAASPLTNLFVALHTTDPTAGGTQASSEATYTNYARIAVARTSGGWIVSTNTVSNTAAINFATCGVTGNTVTHVSIGVAVSGATKLLYGGPLTSPLVISNGITPSFAIGALVVTEA